MKIAIVCDVLGSGNNGTAVVTQNLYEHLRTLGHDVKIICADKSKTGAEGYFILPSLRLGNAVDAYVNKVGISLAKCNKSLMDEALDGVDYIHCMMPFALGRYAADYAKAHGIPISAGFHAQAENITSYLKLNKISFVQTLVYKHLYRKFYKKMDAIHYPTQFIRDVFENAIGHTNGYVISNGVNEFVKARPVQKPQEMSDKIVIATTGRYAREKSQDTLIKAIKYSKYKDKIQLILAGQGAKEKYYRRLSRSLPVQPVFGALSRSEVIDVINYCDIYVHCAEIELEGIACLEAIKCGKLTLVSDSDLSATKSFVADKRCIFKNRDPKSLARAIDFWIEHGAEKAKCEQIYRDDSNIRYVGECMADMDKMIENTVRVHNDDFISSTHALKMHADKLKRVKEVEGAKDVKAS